MTPTDVLSETERFDEFHRRREEKREQAKRNRISERRAVLRFSEGREQLLVTLFRIGETEIRGYVRTLDILEAEKLGLGPIACEYGDVVGTEPVRQGTAKKFDEARTAIKARLRERASSDPDCGSGSEDGRSGTARSLPEGGSMSSTTTPRGRGRSRGRASSEKKTESAPKQTAASKETPKKPEVDLVALRKEIVEAIKKAIPDVETKANKDGRFDRFLVAGKGFVLVFKPTKSGVPLQIPRPLLGKINPTKASGFKEVKWGFSRTIQKSSEIEAAVKAIVLAADAVRPKETGEETPAEAK